MSPLAASHWTQSGGVITFEGMEGTRDHLPSFLPPGVDVSRGGGCKVPDPGQPPKEHHALWTAPGCLPPGTCCLPPPHLSGAPHSWLRSGPGRGPPSGPAAAPWWLRMAVWETDLGQGSRPYMGCQRAGKVGEWQGVGGAFARLSRKQLRGSLGHCSDVDSGYLRVIFYCPPGEVALRMRW